MEHGEIQFGLKNIEKAGWLFPLAARSPVMLTHHYFQSEFLFHLFQMQFNSVPPPASINVPRQ